MIAKSLLFLLGTVTASAQIQELAFGAPQKCGDPVDVSLSPASQACVSANGNVACESRWNGDYKNRTCNVVSAPDGSLQERYGADGYQFECVEFVRRFYRLAKGCTAGSPCDTTKWKNPGNGADYFPRAAQFGLDWHANNTDISMPEVDDILSYSGGEVYSRDPETHQVLTYCGHVNIIKDIVQTTPATWNVFVIEQNVSPKLSQQALLLTRNADSTFSLVDPRLAIISQALKNQGGTGLVIQGWLRVPPALTFSNGPVLYYGYGSSSYSGYNIDLGFPLSRVTSVGYYFKKVGTGGPMVSLPISDADLTAPGSVVHMSCISTNSLDTSRHADGEEFFFAFKFDPDCVRTAVGSSLFAEGYFFNGPLMVGLSSNIPYYDDVIVVTGQ